MGRNPEQLAELREKAAARRLQGRTYDEIKDELGVSKGSLSLWLRDLDHPTPEQRAVLGRTPEQMRAMGRAYWDRRLAERDAERRAVKGEAAATVGDLSGRELDLVAVTAYWCEGAKDKTYARREVVTLINSDPSVIEVWMQFLRRRGIAQERLRFSLSIHESADVEAATRYWAGIVGTTVDRFGKAVLKRHNPKTIRKNTSEAYVGCLVVRVLQSRVLYQEIEGLWRGIAAGTAASTTSG